MARAVSRRELIAVGAAGFSGLALPRLIAAESRLGRSLALPTGRIVGDWLE